MRILNSRFLMLLCLVGLPLACGDEPSAPPGFSLVGTWDWIGFTDAGVTATVTGTMVFRANGTWTGEGTVTFPDEAPESLSATGTYQQTGDQVVLVLNGGSTTWNISGSQDTVVLTEVEPPPANTITLRRR
jgi:hypothetical protein